MGKRKRVESCEPWLQWARRIRKALSKEGKEESVPNCYGPEGVWFVRVRNGLEKTAEVSFSHLSPDAPPSVQVMARKGNTGKVLLWDVSRAEPQQLLEIDISVPAGREMFRQMLELLRNGDDPQAFRVRFHQGIQIFARRRAAVAQV